MNNTLKEIIIYDVQDHTASAKLIAVWGTNYMHLAKYNGRWQQTSESEAS